MIDKPDPAKDAGRSDASAAKRPHATLDLKATEVKPPAPEAPAAGPGAAAPSPGKAASGSPSTATPASSTPSGASSAAPAKPTVSPATSAKGAPSSAQKPQDQPKSETGTKPEAGSKARPTPPPQPTGAPRGGFFSHVGAGVIGGALVYAGASVLGPGWLSDGTNESLSHLASRIAALEALPRESGDVAALDARIGGAESRLAKLDDLERSLTALSATQQSLETEQKSLAAAAQQNGSEERISRLEEQLRMIGEASGNTEGGVPQLAAISGKIADVEAALKAELAELRKSIPAETDRRLAAAEESAEAARSATLRFDRELSQIRTEQARGAERAEAAKADTERLTASVDVTKEETARLSSALGELRSSLDSRLQAFAKPADVTAAVGTVNSKLAELEQNVQSVVQHEQIRRQNAERIVLSLELSSLKRALDRGLGYGYSAELDEVRKVSGGQLDLSPLERFQEAGVATPAQLKAEFRPLLNAVLDADLEPADASVFDRLLAGAKSVVRVRKISHDPGDTSTEAIVSRMEAALDEGRLGDVLSEAKTLPQRARIPLEDWLIKVTARDTVDRAIAGVENRLKASLSGASEPAPPAAVPDEAPAPQQN
ncbi:hypothetical protein [Hyphomicrobium sp.]|uniref:hypothetical protein n=1 Tax=Hyphomicrobium sp. TaxID=82 RepID=UPI002FDEBD38